MPNRKPILVREPKPLQVRLLHQHPLFTLADRYAAKILIDTVTNDDPDTDDALRVLTQRSQHFTPHCDEIPSERTQTGDLMNACHDAGLMLGLALGLRLRGAA
jgi:hypothetical protein